jgi:hypothetical protein
MYVMHCVNLSEGQLSGGGDVIMYFVDVPTRRIIIDTLLLFQLHIHSIEFCLMSALVEISTRFPVFYSLFLLIEFQSSHITGF